jgi:hypothetical protein
MSWKSIVITGLLCVLTVPAWAAPTIKVVDGGLVAAGTHRIFNVFVTPDPALYSVDTGAPVGPDASSMAVELGFSVQGSTIVAATSNSIWEDDLIAPIGNNGNNPFSLMETEGIVIGGGGANVFAALGSSANASGLLQGQTQVLTIELSSKIGLLNLTGIYNATGQAGGTLSVLAQNGVSYGLGGQFGIIGDFDTDGDVDGQDLGPFAGQFGCTNCQGSFANFDGDLDVDGGDLGAFSARFGLTAPGSPFPGGGAGSVAAVPEPTTGLLLMLGMATVGSLARRRSD